MVHVLLVIAAEKVEHSKTAFYVCGALFAAWAVVLGLVGLRSPEFPGGATGQRAVMGVSGILMLGAMATAVITA
jgi:hypothetical protein